jgi:predicted AlkP superfamily phosphohydrolase/phosphomutase
MNRSDAPRVVAVGIDGAEPTLVASLMAQGELPHLRALAARGTWGRVTSPADIGSGAVWPTFMTGTPPSAHGICYDWPWDPDGMRIGRITTDHLTPFWRTLAADGHAVGVLDVPYGPLPRVEKGLEISEWGSHDWIRGRLTVAPAAATEWVRRQGGVHPFATEVIDATSPEDASGLRRLAAFCLAGARARGALAVKLLAEMKLAMLLVVFPEGHNGSHALWHTIDPSHPAHRSTPPDGHGLPDMLREVDRQIGGIVQAAGAEAAILVFSLHGMRARRGVPTILDPLLRALGLAVGREARARSWRERARDAFLTAKGLAPGSLKRLYHRIAPRSVVRRVEHQSFGLDYDWSRTVAFPLPSDQHGWIRLNLAGREAQGILDPRRYPELCTHLERLLVGLETPDGERVVRRVRCLAGDGGPPRSLPDLVVHWTDPAEAAPLTLASPAVQAYPAATTFTGQHTLEGFFVWRGRPGSDPAPATLAAENLHRLLGDALSRPPAA